MNRLRIFTAFGVALACVILLALLGLRASGNRAFASFPNVPGDEYWDDQFTGPPGVDGIVNALAVASNGDVYVGGEFTWAGDIRANNVARWDGSEWHTLGNGIITQFNGDVRDIAIADDGTVYVAGFFFAADGNSSDYIAKWDGNNWSGLGSGVDNIVNALVVQGTNVFVGGQFSHAGGSPANYVAKWDGAQWSALGSGVDHDVYALALMGSDLYVGGTFVNAGGSSAKRIAKWNGAMWTNLGSGVVGYTTDSGSVTAITVAGSLLYVGGGFVTAGGITVSSITVWDGTNWAALENGLPSGFVTGIVVNGDDVYAAGEFFKPTQTGRADYIAKFNRVSEVWSRVGTIAGLVAYNNQINALVMTNGALYAGGLFSSADSIVVGAIAKYQTGAWAGLGGAGKSVNWTINALVIKNDKVYVAGDFDGAGTIQASRVAIWDRNTETWSALGSGLGNLDQDDYAHAAALAVDGNDVYVGGQFEFAGGNPAHNIAHWNGTQWNAMGSPPMYAVRALAVVPNRDVYAAAPNGLFKWNGSDWSSIGNIDGDVWALAWNGNKLYVGGRFKHAGEIVVKNIAQYDLITQQWSALGGGITSSVFVPVYALAFGGNVLYAGGFFQTAGGKTVNNIAAWNGSAWNTVGFGVNGTILALALNGNEIYAAGSLGTTGPSGTRINGIAKWDGAHWLPLGDGVSTCAVQCNAPVNALAIADDDVMVGGNFTTAGNHPSNHFGRWDAAAVIPTPTPCAVKPDKPTLFYPENGTTRSGPLRVTLYWNYATCTATYKVVVKKDSQNGAVIEKANKITINQYKTIKLSRNNTYFWQVKACNAIGCTKSDWWQFTID